MDPNYHNYCMDTIADPAVRRVKLLVDLAVGPLFDLPLFSPEMLGRTYTN